MSARLDAAKTATALLGPLASSPWRSRALQGGWPASPPAARAPIAAPTSAATRRRRPAAALTIWAARSTELRQNARHLNVYVSQTARGDPAATMAAEGAAGPAKRASAAEREASAPGCAGRARRLRSVREAASAHPTPPALARPAAVTLATRRRPARASPAPTAAVIGDVVPAPRAVRGRCVGTTAAAAPVDPAAWTWPAPKMGRIACPLAAAETRAALGAALPGAPACRRSGARPYAGRISIAGPAAAARSSTAGESAALHKAARTGRSGLSHSGAAGCLSAEVGSVAHHPVPTAGFE